MNCIRIHTRSGFVPWIYSDHGEALLFEGYLGNRHPEGQKPKS